MSVVELDISASPEALFRRIGGTGGAFWIDGQSVSGASRSVSGAGRLRHRCEGRTGQARAEHQYSPGTHAPERALQVTVHLLISPYVDNGYATAVQRFILLEFPIMHYFEYGILFVQHDNMMVTCQQHYGGTFNI